MPDAEFQAIRAAGGDGEAAAAIVESTTPPTFAARSYFAMQAIAGAVWWIAVFASSDVRRWTLGSWSHELLAGPDIVLFVLASAVVASTSNRHVAVACGLWTTGVTVALVAVALSRQQAGWGALMMTLATIGTIAATATLWFGGLPRQWFFIGPFAFRAAGDSGRSRHVRDGLTQLVVFWMTFLVVLPLLLDWAEVRIRIDWPALQAARLGVVGLVVFVVGSAVGITSCFAMTIFGDGTPLPSKTARKLVVLGPYRIVRNPMAVAGATQTIGVGLVLGSWTVIVSALAGSALWNFFIRPDEEADLLTRFGTAYADYAQQVRCWIPRLRPVPTMSGPARPSNSAR